MIKTDSAYLIGHDHTVCQDYAYSEIVNGIPVCIISDGCSSAKDSDVGARYLTQSIIKNIDKMVDYETIVEELNYSILTYPFNRNSLLATIRLAFIKDNKLYLFHYGDGYTIVKKDGILYREYFTKYNSNAPFYFYYGYKKMLKDSYIGEFSNDIITNEKGSYKVEDFLNNVYNFYDVIELDKGVYSISLMSDGIDSCYDGQNHIDEVIDFKNTNGEYVKRRLHKFTSKVKHGDDLSLGNIIYDMEC